MILFRMFFGVVFLLLAVVAAHAQAISHVALCDIANNPERFDQQRVSFRSHIESDGMHGAYLQEPECKRGLVFGPDDGADWAEMNRILDTVGFVGTARKSVQATWTGTVHLDGKVVSLSVERIEDISYELSNEWRHVPAE